MFQQVVSQRSRRPTPSYHTKKYVLLAEIVARNIGDIFRRAEPHRFTRLIFYQQCRRSFYRRDFACSVIPIRQCRFSSMLPPNTLLAAHGAVGLNLHQTTAPSRHLDRTNSNPTCTLTAYLNKPPFFNSLTLRTFSLYNHYYLKLSPLGTSRLYALHRIAPLKTSLPGRLSFQTLD